MTVAYATPDELAEFLRSTAPADAQRLLERASEVVDEKVRARFTIDQDTSLPTDEDTAAALRDAACAQVEFWGEVGEDHDLAGLFGSGVAVGNLRVDKLPPDLAPRARRILLTAGLLDASTGLSMSDQFFATQAGR